MHLGPDELLEQLANLAHAERLDVLLDRGAIVDAIEDARALAARHPADGPAATLYAFGRRAARFGAAGRPFVRGLLHAHALAIGCALDMNDVELSVHFARMALGQIEYLELRGWVAARLRPLGQKPKRMPPKRPR
jgi:hypothetical protein